MALPQLDQYERLTELSPGQALYRVHIDALREQNKNARVMDPDTFERLVENIRRDGYLRSLPLCTIVENQGGNKEFEIISGHHRVRASRAAGLEYINVLVEEDEMSRDEIISEQLSQNALQGRDDPQILAELYAEIEDIDKKIETGLREAELMADLPALEVDPGPRIDLDIELINVLFLRRQYDRWQEALALIQEDAKLYIADKETWDEFAAAVRTVAANEDVKAIGAILSRMVDIVLEYYASKPEPESS